MIDVDQVISPHLLRMTKNIEKRGKLYNFQKPIIAHGVQSKVLNFGAGLRAREESLLPSTIYAGWGPIWRVGLKNHSKLKEK